MSGVNVSNDGSLEMPSFNNTSNLGYLACPGKVFYLTKAPEGWLYTSHVFYIVVNLILAICGGTANFLVLLAYFGKLRRRATLVEFNTTVLIYLAAADLLTTGLVQPLMVIRNIMEILNIRSCAFWLVIRRFFEVTVPISFLSIGLITYERYQALFHPVKYRSPILRRRIKQAMLGIWVFSLATVALLVFPDFTMVYYAIMFLTLVGLIVGNTIIYIKIGRMMANFNKNRTERNEGTNIGNETRRKMLARDQRNSRTLFYIFLSVFLCSLPICVSLLYLVITKDPSLVFFFGYLSWADTFAFLNSTLNPFIYCLRNPRLKNAVLGLLCRNRAANWNRRNSHSTVGRDSVMGQNSETAVNRNHDAVRSNPVSLKP